jgi:methionyl-tRNA synthetase
MVSEEGFKARYNSELANELGNLVSRTTSMIGKYRGGAVPAPPAGRDLGPASGAGSPLALEAGETADKVHAQLEDMDLSGALETAWVFVRRLNRYVEEQAPWKLAKEAGTEGSAGVYAAAALDGTLWDLAEGLRLLSVLLHPFIPQTAADIQARLGMAPAAGAAEADLAETGPESRLSDPSWEAAQWGLLPAGLTVIAGAPLFPRIEDSL